MGPAPMDLEKPTAAGEGAGDSVPTSQLAADQVLYVFVCGDVGA